MSLNDDEFEEDDIEVLPSYSVRFHPALGLEELVVDASSISPSEDGSFMVFYDTEGYAFSWINSSAIVSVDKLEADDLELEEFISPQDIMSSIPKVVTPVEAQTI